MRILFLAAILICVPLRAEDQHQLDGNPGLFSVMAALDAAGALPSSDAPLRQLLRQHLAGRKISVVPDLQRFIANHRKGDPLANVSQYVSFALSTSEPPIFERKVRQNELPPDVVELEGFAPLAMQFHEQAGIDDLWSKVQPLLERELARYQEPVTRALFEVNGYLRNPTTGYMGRRFIVYLDLLGPSKQVHTRAYGNDYYVVVPPLADPQYSDIRHAYFHHLIDPLVNKFSDNVEKKKSLIDFAQGAPLLDESYKADFLLLVTESLIKAIESRLARRPEQIAAATSEGLVLAPFFGEHLALYEKQEAAMRLYFPDMIDKIDLKKETQRLDKVQFAAARPEPPKTPPIEAPLPKAQQTLQEAERLAYTDKNFDAAREQYLKVLQQTEDPALHARAYYGLGRIAAQQKNPELAQQLFRKTLELKPDAQTLAWAHVYLGRLAELSGEGSEAAKHYQAALSLEGASNAARTAAEQGLKNRN